MRLDICCEGMATAYGHECYIDTSRREERDDKKVTSEVIISYFVASDMNHGKHHMTHCPFCGAPIKVSVPKSLPRREPLKGFELPLEVRRPRKKAR